MRRCWTIVAILALALVGACIPHPQMTAYDYPALGFSVSFPAPPDRNDVPGSENQPAMTTIGAKTDLRDFAVTVSEVADPSRSLDSLADEATARMAKALGGESSMTYAATPEGLLGREVAVDRDGKRLAKIRIYLAGGRLYILVAESSLGEADPAVDDYLTSFHATAAAPTNAAPANAAG
jgi:hypothetical protein